MKPSCGFSRLLISFTFLALAGPPCMAAEAKAGGAPDEPLARLKLGNERFYTHPRSEPKPVEARRKATAEHQHPFAIIVACSDSRVGPETIFDQTIGDLFIVRTAGNLVDSFALGSIEYAVQRLGARLIVVVGHQRCGAVSAAVASSNGPGHIGALIRALQPAVQRARGMPGDLLKNATEVNAAMMAEKIRREADFGPLAVQVEIVTGYYVLDNGHVEWND
ncbi:MAG TPA: carbonic anhydrase [Opitutus sp.]|nr:carbonic anhydrase [Opitutus sp.]